MKFDKSGRAYVTEAQIAKRSRKMKYRIVQRYIGWIPNYEREEEIKTFKSLFHAKWYKYWHYTFSADSAWKGSFSWSIEQIDNETGNLDT